MLFSGGASFVSYWKSDTVALAMSRAEPADPPGRTPGSTTWSRGCASPAGCPKPRLYVVDDPAPNAFATGRDPKHAAIAVTTGLLEKMNRVELEGVLAHELSHVKNYDILVSTIAGDLVGAIAAADATSASAVRVGGMSAAGATTTRATAGATISGSSSADPRLSW